jgi:threonine dehydrogenase-like Zn-dependent dehydrogenase
MAVVRSLAVVGTGLIGASVGLAARRAGVERVVGWDLDPAHLATAAERGAVEASSDLSSALDGAELAVVAAPVTALPTQVRAVLDASAPIARHRCRLDKGRGLRSGDRRRQVRRRASDLRLGGARAPSGRRPALKVRRGS